MVSRIGPPEGYSERASGLIVPTDPVGSSLDLVRSYCSYERLIGIATSRREVEGDLRELPRLDLATLLSKLTCHLEQSDEAYPAIQEEIVRAFAPARVIEQAQARIAEGDVFTSRQVTLALTKLVLAHGKDVQQDVDPRTAGALLLALSEHLYDDDPGEATADATLSRLGLFSRSTSPGQAWGRYELLWRDIATGLRDHPSAFDLDALVEEAFGVRWDVYEAMGSICYAHFWGRVRDKGADWYERVPLTGTMITDDEQSAFFERWSADESWFATQPIDPLAVEFSGFRQRPLLRNRDEGLAPLSLQFLLYKGSDGFVDGLADYLRARNPRLSLQLRTWFGAVWERYIRQVLNDTVADVRRVVSEEELKLLQSRGRVCDIVISYPRAWLLVEAHARRVTYEGAVRGSAADFEADLRAGVLDEARQLAGSVRVLRSSLAHDGDTYLPVVVVPWPFPVMPTTIRYVRTLVAVDEDCAELNQSGVHPLVVLDGQDWETAVATSIKVGRSLHELIHDWQTGGYAETNFENWAKGELRVGAVVPPSLEQARTRFHERSLKTAFRRS